MTGIGDACLDNDCTILFFGGFGGSEDRIGMTHQTVDNHNFRTAERIQGAVAFAAVDGSGGTDPDPDPTPDPVVNDGIAASGPPGNYFLYAGEGRSEDHTSVLHSLMRISNAVFC